MSKIPETIDSSKIPQHVAVIMDGNGRWARQKGEMRVFGHVSGVESVRNALVAATELGVKYLTLYAFSTENWNRPQEEVNALMDLLVNTLADEVDSLNENNVRLRAIGDFDNLPESCTNALDQAIEKTSKNDRINLVLALSYSSRWEITQATKKIGLDLSEGKISPDEINDELFSSYLATKDIPDPELIIRTSGEQRISNFLLWQAAYAELYFTELLWPDFNKEEFYKAIEMYQKRERRFGMVSEQLSEE